MEQFLEKVMNFINENTMLLIIICIFLIVILVIYLIDNAIKSKRLEKEILEQKDTPEEPKVLESNIPAEPAPVETPAPVVEEVAEEVKEEVPVIEDTTPKVEIPEVEEVPAETPVEPISPMMDADIEALLNKDYSANNEVVNNIPVEPVKEEPKSKYTNDKKLSDIFGKKETTTSAKKIETTQDFSDELDRILQKLNEDSSTPVEDTADYTNMF